MISPQYENLFVDDHIALSDKIYNYIIQKNNIFLDIINNGTYDWNYCLYAATLSGKLEYVQLFINKGADDLKWALHLATVYNNTEIMNYILTINNDYIDFNTYDPISITATEILNKYKSSSLNWVLFMASKYNHIKLINFLIKPIIGITDYNLGLFGAVMGGHIELVNFYINIGATSTDIAKQLMTINNSHIMEYFDKIINNK